VLGPTQVFDRDQPVKLGGSLPRRLLTALIAAGGHPVSDDRLAEVVWAGRPPADPVAALQVYVSRLRSALPESPSTELRRTPTGYRLTMAPGATDVDEFAELTATARALAAEGRPAESRRAYVSALRLWRGEAYADVPDDEDLAPRRSALSELHEAALEDSAAALLDVDDRSQAVSEIKALVRAAPYRERRWALLALALYRSGRQAEALDAVRRARALLAEELGIDPGPELRRLEHRILNQDPALSLAAKPARVSPPLSSFLGRDFDLDLLDRLIAAHRLVTVVGPAGTGKTRLVVEYAAACDGDVWLVRLADLDDPALLAVMVGRALGLPEGAEWTASPRRGLLILDNCEHLPGAVAPLVLDLLARAPGLRTIATSRRPLGADGEQVLPLAPLALDDAVALLHDRMAAIRPAWTPDERERADLSSLAAALDRLPLVLELAAARFQMFGVRELTERLDDRFALLGRVRNGRLSSHATLQGAIAWSVDLLTGTERALLLRLWPFDGGFPATALEPGSLDVLDALVAQSVVEADVSVRPARYRLLETVRAYCRSIDPDPAGSRERHAAWIRGVVSGAAEAILDARSSGTMNMLARELPNIRGSITHDLAAAPEQALRTAGRLMWFWIRAGLIVEGRQLLSDALRAAGTAPMEDVARARAALASLVYIAGDGPRAREMLADIVAGLDETTEPELLGEVRYYQALTEMPGGDPELAWIAATEAHRLASETGTVWLVPSAEMARGAALILAGRTDEGRATLGAAAERAVACGQTWTAALSRLMAAQTLTGSDSRPYEALPLLGEALRLFRIEGDVSSILAVLHNGALTVAEAGDERAHLLRATVHQHLVRYGIQPGRTYVGAVTPEGWYPTDAPPEDPPSLAEAADLLSEIVRTGPRPAGSLPTVPPESG